MNTIRSRPMVPHRFPHRHARAKTDPIAASPAVATGIDGLWSASLPTITFALPTPNIQDRRPFTFGGKNVGLMSYCSIGLVIATAFATVKRTRDLSGVLQIKEVWTFLRQAPHTTLAIPSYVLNTQQIQALHGFPVKIAVCGEV